MKIYLEKKIKIAIKKIFAGQKPFKCQLCDYPFTTKGNLKKHMQTINHGSIILVDLILSSKVCIDGL